MLSCFVVVCFLRGGGGYLFGWWVFFFSFSFLFVCLFGFFVVVFVLFCYCCFGVGAEGGGVAFVHLDLL